MESCTPVVAEYDLGGLVSPECVDAFHHLDFYFSVHGFYGWKAPEVPMQEVAFWFENVGHLNN